MRKNKTLPFRVFGANRLPSSPSTPVLILGYQQSEKLSVKAKVQGQTDLSGSISGNVESIIHILLLFEIIRTCKYCKHTQSITNGLQQLVSVTRGTANFGLAFSVVDPDSTNCHCHCSKSKKIYTLILTNQSTELGLISPPVGVPFTINYYTFTVVGPSSSSNKKNCVPDLGLQLWTNQLFTPASIPALTLPPNGVRTLNLPIEISQKGNVKIDVNTARIVLTLPIGSIILLQLFADIQRDGKSIFNGGQVFFSTRRIGGPDTSTQAEFIFSLTLFDRHVPKGNHCYQLRLTNRSMLNDVATQLFLDTISFQILAPKEKITNAVSPNQNIPQLLSPPALVIPSQSSARFDVIVQKGAHPVKLNSFINIVFLDPSTTTQYDWLRDGESIQELQGPQFVYTEVAPTPQQYEYNFRTSFTDEKVDVKTSHVYTFELINLAFPSLENPTGELIVDFYSIRAIGIFDDTKKKCIVE